ncbi:MAG: EAL domain-containing protein [Marinobacterium sp.]|nr:EAL domain-containing protein [Marinobacterium sp.]
MYRETDSSAADRVLAHRYKALALLVEGASLETVLRQIVLDMEATMPGAICTLLQYDVATDTLGNGIGPSMPRGYMTAADGLPVKEGNGSCGSSAALMQRVVVPDISIHPWWLEYRELARQYNLAACWSAPVCAVDGQLLGTFAIYYPIPAEPSEKDLFCIDNAAALVSLAFRHHQRLQKLKKLSLAIRHSSIGIAITCPNGIIEYTNTRFREISGYARDELLGQSISLIRSSETPRHLYKDLWQTIRSGCSWRGEIANRRKNGELYYALDHISPILSDGGEVLNYVLSQEDITHIKQMEQNQRYTAQHDQLTGLPNRECFRFRLNELLQESERLGLICASHCMVLLDLDNFKLINEAAGRVAGDQVLRQAVRRIKRILEGSGELARLGGDQFAILLPDMNAERASQLLEQLFDVMAAERLSWKGHEFVLSFSAGLVELTHPLPSIREAFAQAESACFAAKQKGKRCIHLYRPGDEQLLIERQGYVEWAREVRLALNESRFVLFAQKILPLQHLPSQHLSLKQQLNASPLPSYEVLLRMQMPDGRQIPPGCFLPAAERYNLMQELDRWVVSDSLRWCVDNPSLLAKISKLCINLSGQSLSDPTMLRWVEDQIQAHEAIANQIKFEITETACIENLSLAESFIRTLQGYGCQFALDDFGSGLSSFGYLKNLPVNTLKIDGLFVRDMLRDSTNLALVRSINEVGHIMGMDTVAEFVENEAIALQLKEMGVDFVQGYGIEKPKPLADVLIDQLPVSQTAEPE